MSKSNSDDNRDVSRGHKRRRSSSRDEVKGAGNKATPHPDLWFRDGNIILVARNTSFKVHKGVLERHSKEFKNMFEKPPPSDPNERVEGCAVVRVSDTPEDVALLLSIMYGDRQKLFNPMHPIPFNDVSGMLRMGTKHSWDILCNEARDRLEAFFPSSLDNFSGYDSKRFVEDAVAGNQAQSDKDDNNDNDKNSEDSDFCYSIRMKEEDTFEVIRLARTFNLTHLLPSAFYLIANMELNTLVQGVREQKLSLEDLAVCLEGAEDLKEAETRSLKMLLLQTNSPKCGRRGDCRGGYGTTISNLIDATMIWHTDALSGDTDVKIWAAGARISRARNQASVGGINSCIQYST